MESRLLRNMALYSLLAGFCKVNLCRSWGSRNRNHSVLFGGGRKSRGRDGEVCLFICLYNAALWKCRFLGKGKRVRWG